MKQCMGNLFGDEVYCKLLQYLKAGPHISSSWFSNISHLSPLAFGDICFLSLTRNHPLRDAAGAGYGGGHHG